jgi:hypothetical protein
VGEGPVQVGIHIRAGAAIVSSDSKVPRGHRSRRKENSLTIIGRRGSGGWWRRSGGGFTSGAIKGVVDLAGDPEAMEEDGEFAGDGNEDTFFCILAGTFEALAAPAGEVGVLAKGAKDVVGALDEETAQEGVTGLGDAELGRRVAGLVEARGEAKEGTNVAALGETGMVTEGEDEGEGGDGANTMDLLEGLGGGVAGDDEAADGVVHGGDLGGEGGDGGDEGSKGIGQGGREMGRSVLVEGVGVAAWKGPAEGFYGTTDLVDEHSTGSDEGGAAADDSKVGLLLLGAMLDRGEEDSVEPANAGEDLGVGAVAFVVALADELDLARIGDDDGEALLAEKAG